MGYPQAEARRALVKVLFFGTPDIAVPYLHWLSQHSDVVGVVCRPDEPVGRGYQLTAPPTKTFAEKKSIPVFQPKGPWDETIISQFKKLNADLAVVVAYGRILPDTVLSIPRMGCVNIHFSLLPKYRGAAPMQWALINGESKTGVTIFWLDKGLDSGPIFHQEEIAISPDDDAERLEAKLVPLGLRLLQQVLGDVEQGNLVRRPQVGAVTPAPILKKSDGKIDWNKPSFKIVNLVRGLSIWPQAVTQFLGKDGKPKQLKILIAREVDAQGSKQPGTIVDAIKDQGLVVQTGKGQILLMDVQPEGKKRMSAWAFWLGSGLKVGDQFH